MGKHQEMTDFTERELATEKEKYQAVLLGIAACSYNFLIIIFNMGFTNSDAIAALDPSIFSWFGQLMILIWGVVFLAAGLSDAKPLVWYAFALEKLVYVIVWSLWISSHPDCFSNLSK